jgi:NAD+ diphosphatase
MVPLYPDFTRLYSLDTPDSDPVRWLLQRGRDLLVRGDGDAVTLSPDRPEALADSEPVVLGEWNGITYLACEVAPDMPLPEGWMAIDLRRLYGRLDEMEWTIAGYATHVLHWQRTSRFCPICGHATKPTQQEWMRRCGNCDHERYPQISPAVLILVHDGTDRILLSHKPGWSDMHSILAGFVLPGESLEECVHREVYEEVGVGVTDLVYQGSQPWPFPQQLMIGFTARYVAGEIRLDEQELDHAAWYDVHNLPTIPPKLSLSRQMIDAWSAARLAASNPQT